MPWDFNLHLEIAGVGTNVNGTLGPGANGAAQVTITEADWGGMQWFGIVKQKADSTIESDLTADGVANTEIGSTFTVPMPPGLSWLRITG